MGMMELDDRRMLPIRDALDMSESRQSFASLAYSIRAQILAVIGGLPYLGFPIWWGLLISERHYSLLSFGLAQTAQLAGWVTTNLLLMRFLARLNRSLLAVMAFVTMGTGYIAVLFVQNISVVIFILGVISAASAATMALATIYLGYTPNPERQYSIQVTATTITQSSIVIIIPFSFHSVGIGGIQVIYAALMFLAAFIVRALPVDMPKQDMPKQAAETGGQPDPTITVAPKVRITSIWSPGIPIIAASCVFASFLAIIYNYSERIGAFRGLGIETTGSVLSVCMLLGSVGAAGGILLGKRVGRILPVAGGALLGCIMVALLFRADTGLLGFAVGITLFSVVYNFVQPYLWAQTVSIDPSGRVVVASGLAVAIGGVAFAGLVTGVSVLYGVPAVLWVALAQILICPLFVAISVLLDGAANRDLLAGERI